MSRELKKHLRSIVIVSVAILTLLLGCSTTPVDRYSNLRTTQMVFSTAVIVVISLHQAGEISDEEFAEVSQYIQLGRAYLNAWEAALDRGEEDAEYVALMETVLDYLMRYNIQDPSETMLNIYRLRATEKAPELNIYGHREEAAKQSKTYEADPNETGFDVEGDFYVPPRIQIVH
jgi:hypothetical protein